MVHGGVNFPSVFVVDSKARPPPLPPKPGRRQRSEVVQTLLVILVFVALFGMVVEACFIYYFYTSNGKSVSIIQSNFTPTLVAWFQYFVCNVCLLAYHMSGL